MDTTKTITHISLCAGYGGIDIGLSRAIPNLRTIAFSEIEAFACANLVAKMEAGLLDSAPIWTNLKTFPWDQFRGKVDIVSGGFPCQPFSSAGKRDGDEDPRHLFPYILDGIGRCRPSVVFLENVEGILSAKLTGDNWRDPAGTPVLLHVFRELERVGYRATAGIFSASEVGAPHQRKRVFIMAHDCRDGHNWRAIQDRVCGRNIPQLPQPHIRGCCEVRSEVEGCGNDSRELAHDNSRGTFRSGYKLGDIGAIRQGGENTSEDCNNQQAIQRCELGNPRGTQLNRIPDQQWSESIEVRQSGNAWPSRPGQPQFSWEPPRVVGNAASLRPCGGGKDGSGEQPEVFRTGSEYSKDQRQAQPSMGRDLNGPSCGVGHAELRQPDYSDCGAGGECGRRQLDDTRGTQLHGIPDQQRQEDPATWESSHLYTTCDNRTDELRLLGNGVVPATAEVAFRTLWRELTA